MMKTIYIRPIACHYGGVASLCLYTTANVNDDDDNDDDANHDDYNGIGKKLQRGFSFKAGHKWPT